MSFDYETPRYSHVASDFPAPEPVTVYRRRSVYIERPGMVCWLARIPSGAHVSSAIFTCNAMASLGLYRTVGDGGAPVAPEFFAKAQRADALTLKIETMIWRALGMSEDPNCEFDIAAAFRDAEEREAQLILTLWCDVPMPRALARASREWVRRFGPVPSC